MVFLNQKGESTLLSPLFLFLCFLEGGYDGWNFGNIHWALSKYLGIFLLHDPEPEYVIKQIVRISEKGSFSISEKNISLFSKLVTILFQFIIWICPIKQSVYASLEMANQGFV